MEWMTIFGVIASIQCIAFSQTFGVAPNSIAHGSELTEGGDTVPSYSVINEEAIENLKLEALKRILFEILIHPEEDIPLVVLDEDSQLPQNEVTEFENELPSDEGDMTFRRNYLKRSRFYRKYPWKRQNSKEAYDAENRYLCQPTREDVFRLLVALHESRTGSRGSTVNFCNRKRPATAVFTNIRFLGKK